MLVLRFLHRAGGTRWHIAEVDGRIDDGAWVPVEALCGIDLCGRITRDGFEAFWQHHPEATICPACLEAYYARLEEQEAD